MSVPSAARIWSWRWLTSYDGAMACSATAVVGARYSHRMLVVVCVMYEVGGHLDYFLAFEARSYGRTPSKPCAKQNQKQARQHEA